ncbi:general secretion pathway protein GspN [Pseudomonas entomophila]|uniref:general secretion pathway protein GspN n=1 Tax=Pseudomonas entomophila TaxID=312306 RepID=UPI00200E1F0E|nr:general secretion pathway protein GspN [Pseudomonas entomophila]
MSRRAGGWLGLVFCLSLLVELPAVWLAWLSGLPAQGVVGSLWQGQAMRLGAVGPLRWELRPWRRDAQVWLGFQGQGWRLHAHGWPWHWQAEVEALGAQPSVAQNYRFAGQWQGALHLQGSGRRCSEAQGRIEVNDLALAEPWSLGLGQGGIEMNCADGWHVSGYLAQDGQHRLAVEGDLLARRAQVNIDVQPDAALTPVLRGVQWLGAEALQGQREIRW